MNASGGLTSSIGSLGQIVEVLDSFPKLGSKKLPLAVVAFLLKFEFHIVKHDNTLVSLLKGPPPKLLLVLVLFVEA